MRAGEKERERGERERERERAGNPHCRGRLCTVDLLAITNLDQLLLILQTLNNFAKQVTFVRRSIVLSLPLS